MSSVYRILTVNAMGSFVSILKGAFRSSPAALLNAPSRAFAEKINQALQNRMGHGKALLLGNAGVRLDAL